MFYILITAFLIILGFIFYEIMKVSIVRKLNFKKRLIKIEKEYGKNIGSESPAKSNLKERVIKPALDWTVNKIRNIAPGDVIKDVEREFKAANYPFKLGVNGWLLVKVFLWFILPPIFLLFIRFSEVSYLLKIFVFVFFTAACWMIPKALLSTMMKRRDSMITRQLPDILDLLTVSVESGLSFDGSLARVIEKSKGELVQELNIVLNEMQLGKSRREALLNMSKRCEVPDVITFINAIIQADELGVSIGKVLRIQAGQMRNKRMQRAREQAMKAPVKILFPLIFFIFPTIFIVILGPAVIQIFESLP